MQNTLQTRAATRAAAWLLASAALIPCASFASISGAVYTSLGDGGTVNQNRYATKPLVYLNGGPQNANGAGLPVGTYYFQVTSPSGVLLSTDPAVCRQLEVLPSAVSGKGVVSGASAASGACAHASGTLNPLNGATAVQLIPFADTPNNGGEYKVWLIQKAAATIVGDPLTSPVLSFPNNAAKIDNFKVEKRDDENEPCKPSIDPGCNEPDPTYRIEGFKFYDSNVNGSFDSGEVGIAGYQIELFGAATTSTTTVLDPLGEYAFDDLLAGTYGVCEVIPEGGQTWLPTTGTVIAPITVPESSKGNNFGNVCLGGGKGRTLGFWSNKNGDARIKAIGETFVYSGLQSLNLRDGKGNAADPGNHKALNGFLLGARATNMANMLSAQLAAMWLNVNVGGPDGKVLPGAVMYVGAAPAGCTVDVTPLGFTTVQALINAANASLGTYNVTTAAGPARSCQEFLKTTLDEGNNNLNFVQTDPAQCFVEYSNEEPSCAPISTD